MKQNYEYIVLGLGGIGAAAACWLARRAGGEVLGLEQFEIGHGRGGSQDHSRIIRLSYHTPVYVRLAQDAYRTWAALEDLSGEQLVFRTGGLDLEPAGSALSLDDYIGSMRACDVPFELLDAAEIMRRWPHFRLTSDFRGLYQAEGGIVAAARCNAAHIRIARAHGATLLDRTPIDSIRPVEGEIEVLAGGSAYRCRKLVIAAGAWTNRALAGFGLRLPLTVTQEQVTYFATPHQDDFAPERFPIWIWMDDPSFYGFPVFGEAAVKVGQDVGGAEVTAETRTFEPNPATLRRVEDFLDRYLPTARGPILYTKTCLYTMPPDRDFIIDTLPDHPNVAVAVGAGHAFKFASQIGKILGELVADGATGSDITPFRIDRPILLEENPARSFLV